ncbi:MULTISPECIES: DUF1707 SHOCT-like domain-containing protein [Amycolatopsis]|uniref:DUF1707 domain-containing protein n=1 Tax=Amycolatopsis albidoflavus TaxID=102226 RepID=A0ABW5HRY8_9PSEU
MDQPGDARASNADREKAVFRLNNALAEGRIDVTEFEERVKAAYESRTYAELAATQQALPALDSTEDAAAKQPADPVGAYLNLRYQQLEWLRRLTKLPAGQRGLAALLVGPAAIAAWVVVNAAYLAVCLAVGLPSDSAWFTLWPIAGAPWGAVILTAELFRRFDTGK